MILATNVKLPIGKIVHIAMTDTDGIPMQEKVPCLILKEVTRNEFVAEFIDKWPLERLMNTKGYHASYFYEFHTD